MARYGVPVDVAWAWLVRTSQQSNKKLRVVAEELVAEVGHSATTAAFSNAQPRETLNGAMESPPRR
jgi:hypothetical protein